MTFYILDHGPAPVSDDTPGYENYQQFTIMQAAETVTLAGQTKILALRPTQRAAEELVGLLRNQEKERG